ncbi:Stearoyl-CoA desaturase (Acyl-CoA desaturase) (Delta(9)-desaturase) (Delta-9 desaturase) (Fatty acid desaturase) [Durusdinium trenchii]|uniref:Stearoyl-CoA desaturase (Acyl-CoA desaturase) (Delta(9)-desaturase) (Delta-9 desaturase) (Fatty acid desaturase) n=1 Tax=Durusdinium trenchii TaxID=1381693 RepID=A0ABP0KC97_9DINO
MEAQFNASEPGEVMAAAEGSVAVGVTMTAVLVTTLTLLANREMKDEHAHDGEAPEGYKTEDKDELAKIAEYEELQKLTGLAYLRANVRPVMAGYITLVHLGAFVGFSLITACKWQTLVAVVVFYALSGFGITGGAHRLWAHKSYKAHFLFRFVVMIFNSIANQGTCYHWVRDHRTHHLYSETKADPHNAIRGFFFSHMGWLYVKKDPRVTFAGSKVDMSDLREMPEIMLQKRLDPWWNLFWCFGFTTLVPVLGWGENAINAYFVCGLMRYVLVLHGTWCVNSLAHMGLSTPYEDTNPCESAFVSFFAIGEGWHNWHHAYPYDYAASELGVSSQYNPTKLLIDTAASLGLVYDRRRATTQWEARKKRKGVKHEDLVGPCRESASTGKGVEKREIAMETLGRGSPLSGVSCTARIEKEMKGMTFDEREEDSRYREDEEKIGGRIAGQHVEGGFHMDDDGDEDMICCGYGGTAEDNEFDEIVGALEEIIMDPRFVKLQSEFCRRHCNRFHKDDENKLEYTDIFNEYTQTIETYLESRLKRCIPGFRMDKFAHMCQQRKDEVAGDVFDILLSCGDFAEFKFLMLSHKAEHSAHHSLTVN